MIIDKLLSDEDYTSIKNYILGPQMRWNFGAMVNVNDGHGITNPEAIETWGFNTNFFDSTLEYADESALVHMIPIMNKIIALNGIETKFKRIRAGMLCYKHGFKKENYNIPHVDYAPPHKTLILYMNDTDGDTYIFNEKFSGKHLTTFTVKQTITPVENRAVIFDGHQYHAASNPLHHDYRVIINVNYV
jgi:hypothetical protein